MAVQLFLNDTEVVIDSTQEIKVTKENPYITLSDSYTLDVSIPLTILQNRRFFGNIQRVDTSKQYREFACRLLCANALVMEGTAHIVQSTDLLVKVQLACGVSALKMSSEQEGTYIDRMNLDGTGRNDIFTNDLDYGAIVGENHLGYGIILLDSTHDTVVNIGSTDILFGRGFPYVSECPRLTDLARMIALRLGYAVDMSVLPEACSHIYMVSAIQGSISRKLPHWTVKEFFTQFQNFFGCTFVRSGEKSLKLVPLGSYAGNRVTEIVPVAEFQVEYTEDDEADGIINSNVEFDMENTDIEVVDEEVLAQAKSSADFTDAGAMENAFRSDAADVRMHKIYRLNGETYIGWEKSEGQYELKRVAPFNPLKRFDEAESVQLKIAPAYMEEDVENTIWIVTDFWAGASEGHKCTLTMPSVSNPYHLTTIYEKGDSDDANSATLQELVEGVESVVTEEDKSDIISVVFMDGNAETVTTKEDGGAEHTRQFQAHLAFTDYNFKKQLGNNRKKWSFSLNELKGYDFYLGQLHKISFTCSHKVKHIVKFLSPSIPDPTDIFLIHGKRFACEKIEASIKDGRLDTLMTGYFYEFLS